MIAKQKFYVISSGNVVITLCIVDQNLFGNGQFPSYRLNFNESGNNGVYQRSCKEDLKVKSIKIE